VNPITSFVRSLGNAGALANARRAVEARAREDWLVDGLARRLDSPALARDAASTRVASPAA